MVPASPSARPGPGNPGRSSKLARIETDLDDARRRAHDIGDALSEDLWSTRPAPADWSVSECLVHLNLTSRAFVPLLERAIAEARSGTPSAAPSYRMDAVGRLVWLLTALRIPINTSDPFVPPAGQPRDAVLAEFDELQEKVIGCVRAADGLPLGRIRVVSPFDARLRYNLYSAFRLVPAHQRLHLRQAQQALRTVRASLMDRP